MKGTRFIMALVLMLAVAFAGFAGGSAERAAPTEPGEIENNLVLNDRKTYLGAQPRNASEGQDFERTQHRPPFAG